MKIKEIIRTILYAFVIMLIMLMTFGVALGLLFVGWTAIQFLMDGKFLQGIFGVFCMCLGFIPLILMFTENLWHELIAEAKSPFRSPLIPEAYKNLL